MASRFARYAIPWVDRLFARDLATARRPLRWLLVVARTLLAAGRSFRADHCPIRAAALTYMTILSVAPVFALAAAAAKGLKADERLWDFLHEQLATYPEGVRTFFVQVRTYVDKADFKALGVVGSLLLVWTALSVFSRVESAFHAIWRVRRPRGGLHRYGNYMSALLIAPILVVVAGAANAAVVANPLLANLRTTPLLGPSLRVAALAVPIAIQIGVFTLLYGTLPGRFVPWRAALAGGIAGGILWQFLQAFYFGSQVYFAKYDVVFGVFAAVPLTLVLFYFGWSVLLFGAEFAHAWEIAPRAGGWRDLGPRRLVPSRAAFFAVMETVATSFATGKGPWRPAARHGFARDEIEEAVDALVDAGILARAESPLGAVLPARPLEEVTAGDVAAAASAVEANRRGILSEDLAALCDEADRAAVEVLARRHFGASPPPPSGAPSRR